MGLGSRVEGSGFGFSCSRLRVPSRGIASGE